jgi:ubiquitin carboxyl-terminal hydrolase L3
MAPLSNYRKHYIPLESEPAVFTQLIRSIGVSDLEFLDVCSIDDPDVPVPIPRPVLALILVFPTTEVYEEQVAAEEAVRQKYADSGDDEDVVWFRQTINNACGLYGILHATCNGNARNFIGELHGLRLRIQCVMSSGPIQPT